MTAHRMALLVLYIALLAGGFWLSGFLHGYVADAEAGNLARGMIALGLLSYVLFTTIPFVPGAEIGFGILMVMGARGALLVYGGMVVALMLAYLVGRFVPVGWVCAFLGALGLQRARSLVRQSADLSLAERTRFIEERAPTRVVPFLLRHRYIAMAVLLNTPGNVILGGGGGLAFAAGASRLFGGLPFLLMVLLAVAPVPLAFLFFGTGGWFFRP